MPFIQPYIVQKIVIIVILNNGSQKPNNLVVTQCKATAMKSKQRNLEFRAMSFRRKFYCVMTNQ